MNFYKIIFLIIMIVGAVNKVDAAGFRIDELHVGGAVDVMLVNNSDSAGIVKYEHQATVDVRKAANALYIVGKSSESPTARITVTVYADAPIKIIEVSGRARLSAGEIKSPDQLAVIASGAASITLSEISAANVNISLSGSGGISVLGELTAFTLNFSLVGSGTLKADAITASRMTISQRGSGKLIFTGSARDCDAVGRGTGTIDLRGLVAGIMDLKLYGEGQIFYPAGVRVTMTGDTDHIIQVKPYQPL